jgi:uncharacterized protein (TIGR02301 family)
MSLRTLTLAGLLSLAPLPAAAQDPEIPIASAPIEMVADLAEVLGRAHAVRTVCNGDNDSTWRNYMLNLMAIEAPSGSRRAALTTAFNRGYRGQNSETSSCTDRMPAIEAGIARRGRELADAIARSYLN